MLGSITNIHVRNAVAVSIAVVLGLIIGNFMGIDTGWKLSETQWKQLFVQCVDATVLPEQATFVVKLFDDGSLNSVACGETFISFLEDEGST